jgi:hypothetical protein
MSVSTGVQGSRRRALRTRRLGVIGLLGLLAVGTAGSGAVLRPDKVMLPGYGSSVVTAGGTGTRAPVGAITVSGRFKIAGSVAGLYPGLVKRLVLTVTNPQAFTIVVTSMTTTVKAASASCPASYLVVSAFSGQLSVPAHGSAKTSVQASLSAGTPDSCTGANFPLVYSGAGREG